MGIEDDPWVQAPRNGASSTTSGGLIPRESIEIVELTKRGITRETCAKWGYGYARVKNKRCQIASYADAQGRVVAQKVRTASKDFSVKGDIKTALPLYGQHLWRDGGKRVIITEGELDALSVSQVQGNKWPVVSIPQGAPSAKKAIAKALEWLLKFEEVVLCFDMDDPGMKAAMECAQLLPPGRAKIASLPLKDANEMLTKGRESELIDALWGAKTFRPDGLVTLTDIHDEVMRDPEAGAPWAWDTLTKLTHGRRCGEVYTIGAGTGIGKTDLLTQQIAYDLVNLHLPVGLFFFEQQPRETARRLAGKLDGERYHLPNAGWSHEQLEQTVNRLEQANNLHLYNHWGGADWAIVQSSIRYLAASAGVKHIYIDHLTALAAGSDLPEKDALEFIMAEIASLAQEQQLVVHLVSHLATPEGKSHEEGGRVTIRHFKGSRAIGYWSHFMLGLERNQQAADLQERQTTTLRILKDRNTGQATGHTLLLGYNTEKGLLYELGGDGDHANMQGGNQDVY